MAVLIISAGVYLALSSLLQGRRVLELCGLVLNQVRDDMEVSYLDNSTFSTCITICLGFSGLHRQILYGGLRIGLYDPVKRLFMGSSDRDAPLLVKVGAGMTTGALAIAIASPTDLVKVC
jgi:hypothetical protein